MARFRIETMTDPVTGKVFSELYYPDDAEEPMARTRAKYDTHEQATADAVELIKRAFPEKPIKTIF